MPAKRTRYRYITSETMSPKHAIASYELHSARQLTADNMSAIRIAVPKGMNVKYVPKHKFSQTSDERTLEDLNYEVIVRMRGRWKVVDELKGVQPFEYDRELKKRGYHKTATGYLTNTQYRKMTGGA